MTFKILTLTYTRSAFGAHMRHEEMVQNLTQEDREVLWLSPSGMNQIPAVKYLNLVSEKFLGSFTGKLIATIISFYRYRNEIKNVSCAFCINEIQVLALVLSVYFFKLGNQSMKLVFFSRMDPAMVADFYAEKSIGILAKLRWSIRKKIFLRVQCWLFVKLDRIVVQAPFLAQVLTRNHPDISSKIMVLPNSTNASWMCKEQVDIRKKLLIDNEYIIAYVGNLHWEGKGLGVFLDVAECLKNDKSITFLVIGEGPDKQRLKNEIVERTLRRVHLLGSVKNASSYMASFDILLATSQLDFCPNVVLESMRVGTLVVATDIPAHKYLLGGDYLGLSSSDGNKMASLVRTILHDKAVYAKAKKQIEVASQRFSFDWAKEVDRMVTEW